MRMTGRGMSSAVRDGITCYLIYHNVMRILGWEVQEEQQGFGDIIMKIGGDW